MSDPFQNPGNFNPGTFNPGEFNPATAGPLWPGHPGYPGRRPDEEWAGYQAARGATPPNGTPHRAHIGPTPPDGTPARLRALQQLVEDGVVSDGHAQTLVTNGRVSDAAWEIIRSHFDG